MPLTIFADDATPLEALMFRYMLFALLRCHARCRYAPLLCCRYAYVDAALPMMLFLRACASAPGC